MSRMIQLMCLADQLQGVPGSVTWPDDCQGWLIIWQTEPGRSEILMDPNVAIRIVLVDAGQDHFFFPLAIWNSVIKYSL